MKFAGFAQRLELPEVFPQPGTRSSQQPAHCFLPSGQGHEGNVDSRGCRMPHDRLDVVCGSQQPDVVVALGGQRPAPAQPMLAAAFGMAGIGHHQDFFAWGHGRGKRLNRNAL